MMYVIAILGSDIEQDGKHTIKGFRLFSTDNHEVRDIELKKFVKGLNAGIAVENIRMHEGYIQAVGFDMQKLPIVMIGSDVSSMRRMTVTIHHLGSGKYLAINGRGTCSTIDSKEVLKLVDRGGVVNPCNFVPQPEEIELRDRLIKELTDDGCTDVVVNEHLQLESAITKDGMDLVLSGHFSSLLPGSIQSNSLRFNSITLGTRDAVDDRELSLVSAMRITENRRLKVNKLILNSCYQMDELYKLYTEGSATVILNFDANKCESMFVRKLSKYGFQFLSEVADSSNMTIYMRPEHRLKISAYERMVGFLTRYMELDRELHSLDAIAKKVNVDDCKSLTQIDSEKFVVTLKSIFCDELYNKLLEYIDSFYTDIKSIIKDMAIIRYDKYNGACILKERARVQCSVPKKFGDSYDSYTVSYVDSESCQKMAGQVKDIRAVDKNDQSESFYLNYMLLGINKNIENELRYCVIRFNRTSRGNRAFSGIENMTLGEVVALLEREPGLENGEFRRMGDYIVIKSLSDISIFDYTIISEELEKEKSSKLKRMERINGLIGADNKFVITPQGYLTMINGDDGELILPDAVKEVMNNVFTRMYYSKLELPHGMKPLTRKNFSYSVLQISEVLVNDRYNAYAILRLTDRKPSDSTGIRDIDTDKVYYKVRSQEDLYRFLTSVWNKPTFHRWYWLIEYSQRLNVDNTAKLLNNLLVKGKYIEYSQALDNQDYGEVNELAMEYSVQLKSLKISLTAMKEALDIGVLNAVKNSVDLSLI